MNNKNKVTIEITAEGCETKISLNGKEYSEVHKKAEHGAEGIKGDFEDVMNALNEIEE